MCAKRPRATRGESEVCGRSRRKRANAVDSFAPRLLVHGLPDDPVRAAPNLLHNLVLAQHVVICDPWHTVSMDNHHPTVTTHPCRRAAPPASNSENLSGPLGESALSCAAVSPISSLIPAVPRTPYTLRTDHHPAERGHGGAPSVRPVRRSSSSSSSSSTAERSLRPSCLLALL